MKLEFVSPLQQLAEKSAAKVADLKRSLIEGAIRDLPRGERVPWEARFKIAGSAGVPIAEVDALLFDDQK